jgi:branched-chain amino acid transport system substrate-binding protein
MTRARNVLFALMGISLMLQAPARAEKKYDTGASDTEVKLGQTMPYSGPASAFGTMGRTEAAYFQKINEAGGIRGRKLTLVSLDDGYSPPKTVEQTRRLVEQEGVLMIYGSVGTAHATATHKYLNSKRVPQLFIATSGLRWDDPKNFPWTMALPPNQRADTSLFVRYLLKTRPNAKVAILYQNDDYGKDYVKVFRDTLGAQADRMVVAQASYEVTDPTADSQVVGLHASGADALFIFASPKFAAMTIRKVYDIGWKPLQFLAYPAASVKSVLQPAGLEKSVGVISASFLKDAADPQWSKDAGMLEYLAFMRKYYPDGDPTEYFNVMGYMWAQALVHVLDRCGDDLTRENIMKQAASLNNVALPTLLPGITLQTSPTDFAPIEQMELERFDGKSWVLLKDR